jgi:lipid A 4'-phosphatase
MNRTGLMITLAIAASVGLIFGLYPVLDLKIAGLFYDPGMKDFPLRVNPSWGFVRDAAMWVVSVIAAPAFIAIVIKIIRPRRKLLIAGRALVFLIATLALAPGLVANVVLKENWQRSRPIDVPQFDGPARSTADERFTAWWDPRGTCAKNCSFIGGESSGAFWTLAPAALSPPAWRPFAYGAALAFGTGVGLLRMAFGAHFLTDIVFSGVIVFLVIWLTHALIYRWRLTRMTDEAVERTIERVAMPPHDAVIAMFAAVFRRGRVPGGKP